MHTDFILSNISDVLEDALDATTVLDQGIPHVAVCEYLLQSIYLKITGYQEQKLKCILWILANDNFDFRYRYLKEANDYRECSQLDDKCKVLKELKEILNDKGYPYQFPTKNMIDSQIDAIRSFLINRFETSIFSRCLPRDFSRFLSFSSKIHYIENGYFTSSKIFGGDHILTNAFKTAYRHRNRCAHNLLSYQNNIPSLNDLATDDEGADNYFSRIFVLFLVDNVFTQMFKHYVHNRRNFIKTPY